MSYDIAGKTYTQLATDPDFWRSLNPDLHISETGLRRPPEAIKVSQSELTLVRQRLIEEGYFKIEQFFKPEHIAPLTACARKLHAERWPETFAFVYDEFWLHFQRTAYVMSELLGRDNKLMPSIWVFFLEENSRAVGWAPHRDRARTKTIDSAGYPHSINIWLPLTDATPENGCMYVLPRELDANYDGDLLIQTVNNFQDIRALPARAGDFLGWNETILHWGGRSSKLAKEPRISMATIYQDSKIDPLEWPLFDPLVVPPFIERVGLIAQQFLRYQVQNTYTKETAQLAAELAQLSEPVLHFDAGNPYTKAKVLASRRKMGLLSR